VLGLERLGHDVQVVEPVEEVRPDAARYFERVVGEFDLGGRAALVPVGSLRPFTRGVDLLLNVSGMLRDETLGSIPIRVYLDLDPVFNQLWHEQGVDVGLAGHTHYVTVGQNLGRAGCGVPTCGVEWIRT